jgi:hypothetical protein
MPSVSKGWNLAIASSEAVTPGPDRLPSLSNEMCILNAQRIRWPS